MVWIELMIAMCKNAKSLHPRSSAPPPPNTIPLFFTSFPWPQGAVSYLDAGALLWALIDCLCAPHSQSGQSAWGPGCLPYLPLLSCHTLQKKKKKNEWREWSTEEKREEERESIYKESLQSHRLFSAPLLLGSLFSSQPETINGVLNQTTSCLVLK